MSVAGKYNPAQDTGNGSTTVFTIPFPFFAFADILVDLFDTSANAEVSPQPVLNGGGTYDYTVSGTQDSGTGEYLSGSVTFNNAPLGNHRISIGRGTSGTQNTSLASNGKFPAKTVEAALDRVTMLVQELLASASKALSFPFSDLDSLAATFPPAPQRAGFIPVFENDGSIGVSAFTVSALSAAAGLAALAGLYQVGTVTNPQLTSLPGDGVTDTAPYLDALTLLPLTEIRPNVPAVDFLVDSTADLPYNYSLLGLVRSALWKTDSTASGITNGVMFRLNTNAGGTWPQQFPNEPGQRIADQVIDATATAHTTPITAFYFAGSCAFERLSMKGVTQGIVQTQNYSDRVRIDKVHFPQPVQAGSSFLVDLNYLGDGLHVDQLTCVYAQQDGSGALSPPKLLRKNNGFGGVIQNLINGDVTISHSAAMKVQAVHNEQGAHTFTAYSGQAGLTLFYMRSDTNFANVPLTINTDASQSSGLALYADYGFVYWHVVPSAWTSTYPTNINNFSITGSVAADFERMFRYAAAKTGAANNSTILGSTCGVDTWDAYSHIASMKARWVNSQFVYTANLGAILSTNGIVTGSSGADSFTQAGGGQVGQTWSQSSATYYYAVTAFLDKRRACGRLGSAEFSVALTNGGNVARIVIDGQSRAQPTMLRIFRGTSTGSYDHYVDVPFIAGQIVYDNGTDVEGFAWISRAAGAMDTINTDCDAGLVLSPGTQDGNSDAYGHAIVYARATAPSAGAWRKGDLVLLVTPTVSNNRVLLGWTRLTDCLSSAPANVMDTDWSPIYASIDATLTSTTTNLSDKTNAINTTHKIIGRQVFNTTTSKPMWAVGTGNTSNWVDATGGNAITPS